MGWLGIYKEYVANNFKKIIRYFISIKNSGLA